MGVLEQWSVDRLHKPERAFASLQYLWCIHAIRLSPKQWVHNNTVRSVLFYGCETVPLHFEDAGRFSLLSHRCPWSTTRISWKYPTSSNDVHRRSTLPSVTQTGMGITCSPFPVVFTHGWRKRCCDYWELRFGLRIGRYFPSLWLRPRG